MEQKINVCDKRDRDEHFADKIPDAARDRGADDSFELVGDSSLVYLGNANRVITTRRSSISGEQSRL